MDNRLYEKVCTSLAPVSSLGELIKGIVIFGSRVQNKAAVGSDIDILVVVDDTKQAQDSFGQMLSRKIEEASDAAKELDLHIQPPLSITELWENLRKGEPWLVTALRNCKIGLISLNIPEGSSLEDFRQRHFPP